MSNKYFFSVIIPIYNVEEYLHACVDSVVTQTFQDIEIILVDDGSPDNCPQICDEYEKIDSRVKVIHKKNGGLSEARNYGIQKATGKYLLFLDSDDYWDDTEALEKIYVAIKKQSKNADVVMFQAKLLYPDGRLIADKGSFRSDFNEMDSLKSLKYMSENGLLIGSACSKVIKREFLVDNNLFFKVGIKSEDIDWILRVANCVPKYQYTDQYFYIYRKGRSNSITSTSDYVYLMQFADILEEYFLKYIFLNEEVRVCLLSYVAYELTILMAKTANLDDLCARRTLKRRIKTLQPVMKYDMHPKVKTINKIQKIFGLEFVIWLLGLYLKKRKR